ncbi:MAG: methylamine utilization protein MauG [Pseudomonadales bacterium]|nr:methylamine utilization protein MauG [Pseudomonadales bacterium]
MTIRALLLASTISLFSLVHAGSFETKAQLGEALFFETSLSGNRTQACATCHMPAVAFTDARPNQFDRAVSIGADGTTHGRRHTPTLSYIGQTPTFHLNDEGLYAGGFFYDGRAHDLPAQADGPIFSPLEMALASPVVLLDRIKENGPYAGAIERLFGSDVLTQPSRLVTAVAESLAAFQRSDAFSPFNSKYDRFLRGEADLTRLEEHGRLLFFSTLINCHSCHQLDHPTQETFTDYTYHNIGTPQNLSVNQADFGLAENPIVQGPQHEGKFRIPTLRNIAITAPYMHNGVFRELETVLRFYNKYVMQAPTNPETGFPWGDPEVAENISLDLLRRGQPLDEYRIESLIAFLKTLTDEQFEHLLD